MGEGPRSLSDYWGMDPPEEAQGPVNLGMKRPSCPICSGAKRNVPCYFNLQERSAGMGIKKDKVGDTERGAVAANGVLVRSLDNTWDSG